MMIKALFIACFATLAITLAAAASQDAPNLEGFKQPGTPPVTVQVIDATSRPLYWSAAIARAAAEWSKAPGVDLLVSLGNCAGVDGKVIVCDFWNDPFNPTPGLPCGEPVVGCTSIVANSGYITSTVIYLNSWYIYSVNPQCPNPAGCMTDNERQSPICHELGHALGIDHPDPPASFYTGCMGGSFMGYVPNAAEMAALDVLYPCPGCANPPTMTPTRTPTKTPVPTATPCPKKGNSGKCR